MRGTVVCYHHSGTCALGHGMGLNKREVSLNPSPLCKYELFRAQCGISWDSANCAGMCCCVVFFYFFYFLPEIVRICHGERHSEVLFPSSILPLDARDRRQDVAGEGKTKQNRMRLRRTNQCVESCLCWQNPE